MLNKIKNSLYRFMYGRNGSDAICKALLVPFVILIIVQMFVSGTPRIILNVITWILIIYLYFRMFSKNIYKRKQECAKFNGKINYIKTRFSQRKQYRFYDCPKCKTHLRVPRGAGKITITCKKCGYQFDRKA